MKFYQTLKFKFAFLLASMLMMPSVYALTIYTAGPEGLINKLTQGFKKQTGISVDFFQATSGKVLARLEAESSNPRADIAILASWEGAVSFDQQGLLLNYQSPNAKTVSDIYKSPSYVAQGISVLGIAWNPKSQTPKPTDWFDLNKPEYKNLVLMPDPSQSGTAIDLIAEMQQVYGDKLWTLLGSLKQNGMTVSGANAQALNPVLQGSKAAVFGAVDYNTYSAINKGESIEIIFPSSGTLAVARPMMIFKSSKNQEDAKKFIDYVLSDEGQKFVAQAYLIPARTDIKGQRPGLSDIKVFASEKESSTDHKQILKHFSDVFAR